MKQDVVVPRLGSSDETDEVKVLGWLKGVGDAVKVGDGLLEVETDKITVEIEAPGTGVLLEMKVLEGEFAKFNDVVAVIEVAEPGS